MHQIWQLICSGWKVMSHASTASWALSLLPALFAAWATFEHLPGPIIAAIFIGLFAAIFLCILAFLGYREQRQHNDVIQPFGHDDISINDALDFIINDSTANLKYAP